MSALSSVGALSFKQWQVWAVIAMASLCGYFSLSVHFLVQDQIQLDQLIRQAGVLTDPGRQATGSGWLVGVNQFAPQLMQNQSSEIDQLGPPLQLITRRSVDAGSLSMIDQKALLQQLHWVATQLRTDRQILDISVNRHTHYYYISVVAFVLALAALLILRRKLHAESGLVRLFSDELLFANAPVALALSDSQDNVLRVNAAFEEFVGCDSQTLVGRPAHLHTEDGQQADLEQQMYGSLQETGSWQGEYRVRHSDGSVLAENVTRISLGEGARAEGYLTMFMEPVISDDEQKLMLWQAHHDNLTKLPNSNLLHERLSRALVAKGSSDSAIQPGAVISIDLNKFQMVNDSIGHDKADAVLMDAAYRIALSARETDTVARVGGDHFVILMQDLEDLNLAERAALRVVEAFAVPFFVDERELMISVSAGISVFPGDGLEKGELLQKADAARLGAKARGDNQIAFFEEDMNIQASRRIELEASLRKAIANDAFMLHYQPIIDVNDQTIYGAEALLRWIDDDLGFVSPAEFIPVAEDSGLIKEIGLWVVQEVQRQLNDWQVQQLPPLRVSLNVSARQVVSEEDAQLLLDALCRSHKDVVTVELTESALVNDNPGSQYFLRGLREQGLKIALDDFGTGWSSVGYLRDYEFDVLKIDKSFIDSVCEVRDHGLVASIVAMGRILGMRVVAEGVEEDAQLRQLTQIGCDYVQGYFFSKPLPAEEFVQFVHSWQRDKSDSQSS